MYPTAEFRAAAHRATDRRAAAVMAAAVTAVFGGLALLYISDRGPYWKDEISLGFLGAAACGGLLTLVLGALYWHARQPCLWCPHCHGSLTANTPQVLAGGCCQHCGRRVLGRPTEPPAEALIPRAEFLAAHARQRRRTGPLMLAAVAATFLGCVAGAVVLDRLDLPDPLGRVLFMLLLMTAPVAMVLVLRWMAAGAKRDPSLACPGCAEPLTGDAMLVAATGHCSCCGCRAVPPRRHPLPPPHAGGWMTVEELRAAHPHRRRANGRALALVLGVSVATVWVLASGHKLWGRWPLMKMGLDRNTAGLIEELAPYAVALTAVAVGCLVCRAAVGDSKRKHPLDCPRCRQEVNPTFAVGTKCCNHCGWRVVVGPRVVRVRRPSAAEPVRVET